MVNRVAISSGHGKYVLGATPPYMDEVTEARRVVAQVATEMRALGAIVAGPFNDDVSQSQNENLNRIVNWHNSQDRELDISVHFNANITTNDPMGTECLYVTQEELAAKVSAEIAIAGHLKDRGPKLRTDLFFLNNTDSPAILIEVCFVDSKADRSLYNQNFNAICRAIAEAVVGRTAEAPPPEAERPPVDPPDRPPVSPPPDEVAGAPELSRGDTGPYVISLQETLGLPSDGDFGAITEAGVINFQRAWGLTADGIVGQKTWAALDELDARMERGSDGLTHEQHRKIEAIVADSQSVLNFTWHERGKMTKGYYVGMAKTFAISLLRLRDQDEAFLIMAQANTHDDSKDALSWYNSNFRAIGMNNDRSGPDTLRHLFMMMVGLGPRESSGNHWEGRDMSAENVTSDTCEAGLFQTSWNIRSCASTEMGYLFAEYKADPNGFRPDFTQGLYPNTGNLDNYGSGDGCYYQWLSKYCPAFHCLITAIGMRRLGGEDGHWGPIRRKEVQLVQAVDDMLLDVQQAMMGEVA